jgi:uncharacterized protein (DUF1501 family)
MYGRGELAVLHAVGLPYRDRSHFDAQQVLESGGVRPYEIGTGWLARALAPTSTKSIALSTGVPLVLRGPGVVDTWARRRCPTRARTWSRACRRCTRTTPRWPPRWNALARCTSARACRPTWPAPT